MNYVLGGRSIGQVLGRSAGTAGNGLLTGLVAYWKLDEASGNAIDAHSSGLTLTQVNSPGSGTGKVYATARTFNGGSQYFSRNNETALQTGDIDFTFAAWVNISSYASYRAILGKQRNVTTQEYLLYVGGSQYVHWQFGNNGNELDPVLITDTPGTGWMYIVAWQDTTANVIGLQINDRAAVTITRGAKRPTTTDAAFNIGRRAIGDLYFNSRIGPVAFWKRTLSAADRTALWNGGNGLAYASFS